MYFNVCNSISTNKFTTAPLSPQSCEIGPPSDPFILDTPHNCSAGVRYGEFGGQVNTFNFYYANRGHSHQEKYLQCCLYLSNLHKKDIRLSTFSKASFTASTGWPASNSTSRCNVFTGRLNEAQTSTHPHLLNNARVHPVLCKRVHKQKAFWGGLFSLKAKQLLNFTEFKVYNV